ncbi:UNVERIFIED_CONTAM: hypothetical protein PYX00_001684 [Menopon gallinae]|uniref:Carboxylic ester hydrolase n=1 Tax=Menopon gallinae TaxID=328185 RepID=A0AAW2IEE7_9NEOP
MIVRGLLSVLVIVQAVVTQQPRATVENGVLVGKYVTSHYGNVYQSFLGIPYAMPPIESRRFREAEPLRGKWIGEWNATEPGSPCLQYDHFSRHKDENGDWVFSVVGDEDCLFLNVHTKEDGATDKDVIFLIHGGGFTFGYGHVYGPDYLIDIPNVVIVTTNYRLGPLGFLTTGDSVCPGNNGLKDQTLALEWVRRNIHAFGGDPEKVTLVGLSAGGVSVHYHYLSELSEGLFKRGYSFSGSVLCPWAFQRDGVEKAKKLATNLGCPISDSKTMVKCLRRRPARKIVEQQKSFQNWIYAPFNIFGPTMEIDSNRPFIEDEPRNLLRQGKVQDLPWITSFTSEDGLYPAGDFVDDERLLRQLEENWDAIAPSLLFYKNRSGQREPISKTVKEHYLGKKAISGKTVQELIHMIGDRLFIAPAVESAALQAQKNSQPVYLYSYNYEGTLSTSQFHHQSDSKFGVSHGDDFAYVVKFGERHTHINGEDKKMADFLLKIMEDFVKKGSPTASLNWAPVSPDVYPAVNLLRIGSVTDVKMQTDDRIGNVRFLREVLDGVKARKDEL